MKTETIALSDIQVGDVIKVTLDADGNATAVVVKPEDTKEDPSKDDSKDSSDSTEDDSASTTDTTEESK